MTHFDPRFNPDSAKYGFSSWPGGLAHNAYNASELEPYTGRLNIEDYLEDLQFPQMVDLALKYDTDIMVRIGVFLRSFLSLDGSILSGATSADQIKQLNSQRNSIIMLPRRIVKSL